MQKRFQWLAPLALAAATLPLHVMADPPAAPDTTAAVTYITTNGPTVLGAIGAAMVIIAAVAVLWKWGKAAIFG